MKEANNDLNRIGRFSKNTVENSKRKVQYKY